MLPILSLPPMTLPPVPPWEGAHVVVIHFPLALLLVAPLFVFLAAIMPQKARWASLTALILLVLGTSGLYLAVATGEAAQDAADGPDAMYDVLEQHEELARLARTAFTAVTAVYGLLVLLPYVVRRLATCAYLFPVNLLFCVVLLGGGVLLGNVGHLGGRIVHQYGVHAQLEEGADDRDTPVGTP